MLTTVTSISKFVVGSLLTFYEFGLDCHLYGRIHKNDDFIDFLRYDNCSTIKYSILKKGIVLYSRNYWVFIPISGSFNENDIFYYRWGSDRAYIGGSPVDIEFGYVIGG
jgi:hypothetical protein